MMNYIKSEFYRVSHSRGIYCLTGILAVLSFLLNFVLWWFRRVENFRYSTTSFSYSNLVVNPMIFCVMSTIIALVLYEENSRNGSLKNTISFGISRTKVFAGECIVSVVTATISMIVVLTVYIASAVILLEQSGPVSLNMLLSEVVAVFLIAVAALISGIVFIEGFGKNYIGMIIWVVIWFVIPRVFFYLGFRIEIIHTIAMWMPDNFFGPNGMTVNMSESITAWGTAAGMAKCLIAGIVGIAAFSLTGVVLLRKREL